MYTTYFKDIYIYIYICVPGCYIISLTVCTHFKFSYVIRKIRFVIRYLALAWRISLSLVESKSLCIREGTQTFYGAP